MCDIFLKKNYISVRFSRGETWHNRCVIPQCAKYKLTWLSCRNLFAGILPTPAPTPPVLGEEGRGQGEGAHEPMASSYRTPPIAS